MIPLFDFGGSAGGLQTAAQEVGTFYARHPLFPESRCARPIEDARCFFALAAAAKQALAIEGSSHYRGYSEMRNERDWREQIHFGREEPAHAHYALRGPNLWPDDPDWTARMRQLMADLEQASRDILAALAAPYCLMRDDEKPYLLMKLIHYPPPVSPQSGVAAHVDFSWITLLLQDDTGGLEVRTPRGDWMEAPAVPGCLIVNLGEILQFATRGRYQATPHRVTNRSGSRSRISIPFFLNPGLCTRIQPLCSGPTPIHDADHVHRVLEPADDTPFLFGEAEWLRKGLGIWCRTCAAA